MGSGERGKGKGRAFCAVKYVFIIFNVLIWLLGFGVLFMGVWMHANRAPYSTLLPNTTFLSATVLTICAGAIMFIIGFCGCCGAILESQCMLVVYFVFVLVVFGLEVTATALGLTHKQQIENFLHEEVMLSIKQDYNPEDGLTQNAGLVAVVDNVQHNLQCCGIDNLTDWHYIGAWPDKANVPASCCVHPVHGCGSANSNSVLYSRGCLKEVEYWLIQNMYTLGILALAVAVVQILAMAAAVGMFCCLRKNKSIL